MTLNEYQQKALTTAWKYRDKLGSGLPRVIYAMTGLVGEAGEYANKIKKIMRDDRFDRDELALELGDALWYLAASADELGFTLEEIACRNVEKLADRAERDALWGSGDSR